MHRHAQTHTRAHTSPPRPPARLARCIPFARLGWVAVRGTAEVNFTAWIVGWSSRPSAGLQICCFLETTFHRPWQALLCGSRFQPEGRDPRGCISAPPPPLVHFIQTCSWIKRLPLTVRLSQKGRQGSRAGMRPCPWGRSCRGSELTCGLSGQVGRAALRASPAGGAQEQLNAAPGKGWSQGLLDL